MSRSRNNDNIKMAKHRRQYALDRPELRGNSVGRISAASPTSFPLKAQDPDDQRLIAEALAKRGMS